MPKDFRAICSAWHATAVSLLLVFSSGFPLSHHAALASENTLPGDTDTTLDNPRLTNEVILRADSDSVALRSLFPPGAIDPRAGKAAEDVIVAGIHTNDPVIVRALLDPLAARYLIAQDRLEENIRRQMPHDEPLEVLHRYVVLSYSDVVSASTATEVLKHVLGPELIAQDETSEFAWTPSDPYVAIIPGATNAAQYQWGLHALRLPAAWDLTRGYGYVGVIDGGISNDATSATIDDVVPSADLVSNFRLQFYTRTQYRLNTAQYHGSHVSGIVAATSNNNSGVSGACPLCSLIETEFQTTTADYPAAITSTVQAGAQVINMSWGSTAAPPCPATGSAYQAACTALSLASSKDVVLIGAAGNYTASKPQWPASEPTVLSVGGAQTTTPGNPSSWQVWYFGPASPMPNGEGGGKILGTNNAGISGVMAPARGIVSTYPAAGVAYSYLDYHCGDTAGVDESGVINDAFGSCSGTSMAAPFISALAGLLRSINPRLTASQIENYIRQSGDHVGLPSTLYGTGMPNASSAANQVAAATPNHLTPLFSLYSSGRLDYFYTSVPQMGATAECGFLRPKAGGTTTQNFYTSVGTAIAGYNFFPSASGPACSGSAAKAQVWVFTTPTIASTSLVPLYRMSWKCGDPSPSPPAVCSTNPVHADITYTTDSAGISAFQTAGYKLDGIEGYIYPGTTTPQPPGTVRLMRKYNPARDDNAIFPETALNSMIAEGYTENSGSDWIGYVYVNTGGVPSI